MQAILHTLNFSLIITLRYGASELPMSHSTLTFAGCSTFPPNANTKSRTSPSKTRHFISLLQNCKHFNQIPPLHANIIRNNHDQDPFIVFDLLRVCSNLNSINYASKIFSYTQNQNVYLYTAVIDGFVVSSRYSDGIFIYHQMINASIQPDNYAITSVLRACGCHLALKEAREIHCQVLKLRSCSNRSIRMKLMQAYGKCGVFEDARRMFDEMPEQDVVASTIMINCYCDHRLVQDASGIFGLVRTKDTVCWTAMIDGLVRNGEMSRALEVFREMQRDDVKPNEVTIVCILSACSQLGALQLGKWVHSYMGKHGIELNQFVGGALINMYLRCGHIDEALKVFGEMEERNVITYNSMIMGLALHGRSIEAFELFRGMIKQGLRPTSITFVGVLNACSHGGLADLGFQIFHSKAREYGIEPQIGHCGCMVDLLGRLGWLEEAYGFISTMKVKPDHLMLGALLSACKIHGNLELGEKVAKCLMACGNADSGTYVLLSTVYSSSRKWKEAAEVRAWMKEVGMEKEPRCSSVEVNNEIHEFLLGDIRHPQKEEIYTKLKELNQRMRLEGYTPETEVVLQDIENWEKEWALAIHSEKLAICYGLISTKPFSTIRIVKNLRVCNDCHSTMKLISKISKRKIVVRDRNRFHHFENGACSCGDYW